MKTLTTSQAWAKIAAAYERKIFEGVSAIYEEAPAGYCETAFPANCGLCMATGKLMRFGEITFTQRERMMEQIDGALVDSETSELNVQDGPRSRVGNYLADYSLEGDAFRAVLATLFSESSK